MIRKTIIVQISIVVMIIIFSTAFSVSEGKAVEIGKKGVITGKILIKDSGPLSGGQVIFFNAAAGPPPEAEKYDRTPEFVRDIDAEGRFNVELPPGTYYLGASRKASGEPIGPPQEGDYVWRSLDSSGKPKAHIIKAGERLDIGTVAEAVPLKAGSLRDRAITTAIEGAVLDMDGKPVSGAVVVAFADPSLKGKPLFVSERTDENGKYLLRISAGTYYIRARNEFASGPPEPGQIVGFYGEGTPAPVTIRDGERLKDMNFKVILFPGRGPFSGTAPGR